MRTLSALILHATWHPRHRSSYTRVFDFCVICAPRKQTPISWQVKMAAESGMQQFAHTITRLLQMMQACTCLMYSHVMSMHGCANIEWSAQIQPEVASAPMAFCTHKDNHFRLVRSMLPRLRFNRVASSAAIRFLAFLAWLRFHCCCCFIAVLCSFLSFRLAACWTFAVP